MDQSVGCGCQPTGWIFWDSAGKTLAYQSYRTLELRFEANCPEKHKTAIKAIADRHQAMRGQTYQIAGNMTVVLGE